MKTPDCAMQRPLAPQLLVAEWLNTPQPITLTDLRGKVVLIEAFQMLCPGCVSHGLPVAARVAATFPSTAVAVIGLHTVFEHHNAQLPRDSLEAFLGEYGIAFPVGIDLPSDESAIPRTMAAYHMQGTPTTILVDRVGRLARQTFGRVNELALGADIGALLLADVGAEETSRGA